ncbi:hypothetical protein [Stutzerimonas stutzeri]|jgi:hypothetical protein|uniref:Uncharacterized protein n=1 Tax=Stutzerimonas stutzeri TaxID=316 RepID=A0AA40V4T4_STUST|nr:hypothetical protein [Stutzerimonas stutzeri]MBA1302906.1 hypothetical protein [Stutzerimonas stutzeri]
MNPRIKKLLRCAAIAALLAAGPNLNAKGGEMPKKMMMYYGGFEIEEMFDASQWFTRGMYRTRNIEADGGASNVTMLRSQPKPFTREQLSELPYAAAEAFDASHLEDVDTEALILNPPNLGHRIRYAYSAFAEPNKPEDYYYLYLDLAGRRFAVTFSRDVQTGDNLTGKAVKEISGDYASQAEHRKAFAEIDAFERKAR